MDMAAYTPFSLFRVPSGGGDQVKVVDGPERGVIDLAVSRRRKRERERVSISFFSRIKAFQSFGVFFTVWHGCLCTTAPLHTIRVTSAQAGWEAR